MPLTTESVLSQFNKDKIFKLDLTTGDYLAMEFIKYEFLLYGKIEAIIVYYARKDASGTNNNLIDEYGIGIVKPGYDLEGVQYFQPCNLNTAITCLLDRNSSSHPEFMRGRSETIDYIRVHQEQGLSFEDPAPYIAAILTPLLNRIFNKVFDPIITENIFVTQFHHYYKHFDKWKAKGFDPYKAATLHILCHSKLAAFLESKDSYQWVVDNYSFYLPHILDAEKEVLKTVYNLDLQPSF